MTVFVVKGSDTISAFYQRHIIRSQYDIVEPVSSVTDEFLLQSTSMTLMPTLYVLDEPLPAKLVSQLASDVLVSAIKGKVPTKLADMVVTYNYPKRSNQADYVKALKFWATEEHADVSDRSLKLLASHTLNDPATGLRILKIWKFFPDVPLEEVLPKNTVLPWVWDKYELSKKLQFLDKVDPFAFFGWALTDSLKRNDFTKARYIESLAVFSRLHDPSAALILYATQQDVPENLPIIL